MFLNRDINKMPQTNLLQPITTTINDDQNMKEKRKPILKKNSFPKNADQDDGQSQKQNQPHLSQCYMSQANDSGSQISIKNMRRIQEKKNSIFLELNRFQNSIRRKDNGTKNISFQTMASVESQIFNNQSKYKQSKIDIVFSNQNIEDSLWNGNVNENANKIDFDLPQKSYSNFKNSEQKTDRHLKGSEVVSLKIPQSSSLKLKFEQAQSCQIKKSDRIVESDTKRNQNLKSGKEKNADKLFSQNVTPSPTIESDFVKKTEYYDKDSSSNQGEGQWFMIKQTPPPNKQILRKQQQRKYKMSIESSQSEMKMKTVNPSQLYRNRIEDVKKKLVESMKDSNDQKTENLLVTLNPVSSTILPGSNSLIQPQLDEFKEDFFNKINTYRFLNRLSYKIIKFLDFNKNKKTLKELQNQINQIKCFNLLDTQLELQKLQSFPYRSEADMKNFTQIVQVYIEKERQQSYWRHLQTEFLRHSNPQLVIDNDKVVKFLQQTIPEMQKYLTSVELQLERNKRTKQTLLAQLRLQLLKHLLYDVMKMNLVKHSRLPVTMKTNGIFKQRLIQIIEKDQWLQKVTFCEIIQQFHKLKQDFRYLSD